MKMSEYLQAYWKQYMLIEKEFIKTSLYVSLDTDNFNTYSPIYLKLILEIGSEIDNVFKEICGLSGITRIDDYAKIILAKFPAITTQSVSVKDSSIIVRPFNGWNTTQSSKSLPFWEKYNNVKHERIANYKDASLSTSICALGGLFILLMYRMNEIYENDPEASINMPDRSESELLVMDNWALHIRTDKVKTSYQVFDDSDGGIRII